MNSIRRFSVVVSALVVCASLARAQGGVPDLSARTAEIPNWAAPPYWNPPAQPVSVQEREGGVRTEGVSASSTSPLPFIGVDPCRLVDTRQAGFPAGYGPPALVAGLPRDFDLNDDPLCPGIPASVGAYSLNLTVTNAQGPGHIVVYPQGGASPPTSTLNYTAGQTIANAAVVPAGAFGGVTVVAAVSGTDLIIDINGYYGGGVGEDNTFVGLNAGNFTMGGARNTGIGTFALQNNTSGSSNTASGWSALFGNTTGTNNTATGARALESNTTGDNNTAVGSATLNSNTTGIGNTATGHQALLSDTTGCCNTAIGYNALYNNTTGHANIAVGTNLFGVGAGVNLTTGDYNIDIGNQGVAGESATIRIGQDFIHMRAFLAGVRGVTTGVNDAVPVVIDSAGQLGAPVVFSSRRVKEEIEEMGDRTDRLLRLRPVTFRYKPELDPSGTLQYGLIAEEVAEVFPELVVYDREGHPETVRYQVLPSLLLNEMQRQQRTIEGQQREIDVLRTRLERLEALRERPSKLEVSAK